MERFDDNTARPSQPRQPMAQIRRFIPSPLSETADNFHHVESTALAGHPRRTLIRAIRAGFERDSAGYKSGLDTSDYWCAATAICDAV